MSTIPPDRSRKIVERILSHLLCFGGLYLALAGVTWALHDHGGWWLVLKVYGSMIVAVWALLGALSQT